MCICIENLLLLFASCEHFLRFQIKLNNFYVLEVEVEDLSHIYQHTQNKILVLEEHNTA